jgi:hypothetical protein
VESYSPPETAESGLGVSPQTLKSPPQAQTSRFIPAQPTATNPCLPDLFLRPSSRHFAAKLSIRLSHRLT